MDPYYFMEDDLEITENDDNLELYDIIDYQPDGSWIMGDADIPILFKDEPYDVIKYNNNTNKMVFIKDGKEVMVMEIVLRVVESKQ